MMTMRSEWIETARYRDYRGEFWGVPCSEESVEGYYECGECHKHHDDEAEAENCCVRYCATCSEEIAGARCCEGESGEDSPE